MKLDRYSRSKQFVLVRCEGLRSHLSQIQASCRTLSASRTMNSVKIQRSSPYCRSTSVDACRIAAMECRFYVLLGLRIASCHLRRNSIDHGFEPWSKLISRQFSLHVLEPLSWSPTTCHISWNHCLTKRRKHRVSRNTWLDSLRVSAFGIPSEYRARLTLRQATARLGQGTPSSIRILKPRQLPPVSWMQYPRTRLLMCPTCKDMHALAECCTISLGDWTSRILSPGPPRGRWSSSGVRGADTDAVKACADLMKNRGRWQACCIKRHPSPSRSMPNDQVAQRLVFTVLVTHREASVLLVIS